jgi:hypothetical protein
VVPEDGKPGFWERLRNWIIPVKGTKKDERSETQDTGDPIGFSYIGEDVLYTYQRMFDYDNLAYRIFLRSLLYQTQGNDSKANGGGIAGGYEWLHTTANIFGAAGLGGKVKTEVIEYAIRNNYKSATTNNEFNKLRPSQKAWRISNTLGKTGASYLKITKGFGVAGNIFGVTSAGVMLYQNPTAGNATRLAVQGVAIGAAFIPVVGWGISLGIGAADVIWGDDFYNWIDR